MNDTEILQIPIKDYLEGIGIHTRKEGGRYFCSSPFSRDSNWSFCIYPTNTYFDFSTGQGGNILNLVSRLESISLSDAAKQLKQGLKYEKYKPNYKKVKEELYKEVEFDPTKYVNNDESEIAQIRAYAESRGITDGYFPGVFFTRQGSASTGVQELRRDVILRQSPLWVRVPALGFLHVDKQLKPCGAKFRRIVEDKTSKDQSPRFSARGNLGFYILELKKFQPTPTVLYVVESESSANSLWSWLNTMNQNSIVLSRGGVSSAPKLDELPEHLQGLSKKLIIDYDGNEQLYNERLKLYSGLDAQPIKLILPKGEDINSLYVKNEMWKIEQLLL